MTMQVDVRDLLGQPGASRKVAVHEPVEGLAAGLVRVPDERSVDAELLLESLVEGILATGRVSGVEVVSCARCLEPTEAAFDVEVQELFATGATPEDDEYPIRAGEIDLEPMIRDAVLLAAPFAPLCSPECRGLCERCGGDRNAEECSCPEEVDPRWEALSGLRVPQTDR
jgi:DUF177 domain-containing protein